MKSRMLVPTVVAVALVFAWEASLSHASVVVHNLIVSNTPINLTSTVVALPTFGLSARAEVVTAGLGETSFDDINTPAVANKIFSNNGVSGESYAIANYGLLKASSTLTKGPAIEAFNLGTGEAIFSDELTITGGSGAGTLVMQFHNTGVLTIPSPSSSATARTTLNVFFTDGTFQGDNREYMVTSGSSATIDDVFSTTAFDFTFGVPFSFDVRLLAEVAIEENDSGTVNNDFFNTSTLQLLTVSGATGPVSISAASGTTYPIPEPASILLMIVAAASLSRRPFRIASQR